MFLQAQGRKLKYTWNQIGLMKEKYQCVQQHMVWFLVDQGR